MKSKSKFFKLLLWSILLLAAGCTRQDNFTPSIDTDAILGRKGFFNTSAKSSTNVILVGADNTSISLVRIEDGKEVESIPLTLSDLQYSLNGNVVTVRNQPGIFEFNPASLNLILQKTEDAPPPTIDTYCKVLSGSGPEELRVELVGGKFAFNTVTATAQNTLGGDGIIVRSEDSKVVKYRKSEFGTLTVDKRNALNGSPDFFKATFDSSEAWPYSSQIYCHLNNVPTGIDQLVLPNMFSTFDTDHQMKSKRAGHTATLLKNGRVLIVGGSDGVSNLASVEIFDPATSRTTELAPLVHGRQQHSATLLENGKVLIVGGWAEAGSGVNNVELYDPSGTGLSVELAPMKQGRSFHGISLLPSGKLLITGGMRNNQSCTARVELYDPENGGSSVELNPLPQAMLLHTQTLLPDGTVLLAGGYSPCWVASNRVRTYALDGTIADKTPLSAPALGANSLLLNDGDILFAGGLKNDATKGTLNRMERYHPVGAGSTSVLRPMITPRAMHGMGLMPDGRVLISGGCADTDCVTTLSASEIYDLEGGGFSTATAPTASPRGGKKYSAASMPVVTLKDGRIFFSGGNQGGGDFRSDFYLYSQYAPSQLSVEGRELGTYLFELVTGMGTIYQTGLYVPRAPGNVTIRAYDLEGTLNTMINFKIE